MKTKPAPKKPAFPKSPTGIRGLDEITGGGLPTGRPTLLCGGTGCGKTMLAMEFLIRGALEHGEPGVFMAFEETAEELADLVARKKLSLDHVHIAQARTRWMRVMKYRGTEHGSNEYPFLIDRAGVSGWPITSLRFEHAASTGRAPTGIPQNLKALCEAHLAGQYRIEVIDLVTSPQLAQADQILALPTLVRKLPLPIRKLIGDLSNTERVLVSLDVRPNGGPPDV